MQRLANWVWWGSVWLLGIGSQVTSVLGHQAPHLAVSKDFLARMAQSQEVVKKS